MDCLEHKTQEYATGGVVDFEKAFAIMVGNVDVLDKYDIEFNVLVQKRRHKNKRINKKWAKMYGYEIVNQKSKGWHMLSKSDGSIEFLK